MDLGTLFGILAAFGLILGSMMMGGSIMMFVNVPSILIVILGTIAATLVANPMKLVFSAFKVAGNAFFDRTPSASETSARLQELAAKVRREGILILESEEVSDTFLNKAIRLAVDGVPPETIGLTLRAEMASMKKRHTNGQQIFKFMTATAPAMGMIGTLIGLVQMLQNLSDPSSIGPAMAVAMLTTLYGAVIANVVCGPIAAKLAGRTKVEAANMIVIIEGIDGIVRGENAMIIKERVESHLDPQHRGSDEKTEPAAA